jgi:ribonuclease VapC
VTSVVLDASAMIAFLRSEPGADIVGKRVCGALISTMNYSKVLKKTIEIGGSADAVRVHSRVTKIYDRRKRQVTRNIVERISV